MMIQRIQSLFLLIAAGFMAWFSFRNLGSAEGITIPVESNTILWIASILTAVLYFIAIFLFKNPQKQKTAIYASMLITFGIIIAAAIIILGSETKISPDEACVLPLITLLAAFRAIRGINNDIKIIRDSERIR